MLAVAGVNGFVGPVKVHVMLAQTIATIVERLCTRELMLDILGLKEIQHAQAVDRILPRRAVIYVGAERDLFRFKSPRHQTFITHAAVARLVISPAGRIVNPFPGKNVSEGAQHDCSRLDRPDFIQVTDRRTNLQPEPVTVGIVRINYVGPIEPAEPETRISRGACWSGVWFATWN